MKTKRILSALISLVMIMSIITAAPAAANAAEADYAAVGLTDPAYPDYEYSVLDDGTAEITKFNHDYESDLKVDIPSSLGGYTVTSIGSNSFYNNQNFLVSVTIPDTVTNIGASAFRLCTGLKKADIPDSVKKIGDYAFYLCRDLGKIVIPDSVTEIGKYAFSECDSAEKAVIGSSVTALKDGTFCNCPLLENVTLGSSVKAIGYSAFRSCSLLSHINIPEASSIGKQAFRDCKNLEKLFIPESVTDIAADAFEGCERLTIEGCAGSAAQTYAADHIIPFADSSRPQVSSVVLSATSKTLVKGEEIKLTASVLPDEAEPKTVVWSSSDSSVANVDQTGCIFAKSVGKAVITASASNGVSASCSVTVSQGSAEPASDLIPRPFDCLNDYLIKNTYIVSTRDGYMRLFCDNNGGESSLSIEYYTSDFTVKSRRTLKLELPLWGGFYEGSDAYYLVEGQNNTDCVDGTEVVRVIKYSKSWERLGSSSVLAKDNWEYRIRYPFNHGCVNMTELNGKLYITTARQGYVDSSIGQGHQGMMLIQVDEETMEEKIIYGDFWHSFSQYICTLNNKLYILEESEGDQATNLTKFDPRSDCGYFGVHPRVPVLEYGGRRTSVWAVATYASADGIAAGTNNILGVGTSIDQSLYDSYDSLTTPYNIYLTVTPTDDFSEEASKLIWITDYSDVRIFDNVKLAKINDNRFILLWSETPYDYSDDDIKPVSDINDPFCQDTMHYVFLDADGNKISKEFTADAALSSCDPVVDGSQVILCSSDNESVVFYTINADSGKLEKKIHNVAGEKVTWSVNGDTMTVSGKGEMSYFPYLPENSTIKKLVISDGITSVPYLSLTALRALETVSIEGNIESFGGLKTSYMTYDPVSGWFYINRIPLKDVYICSDITDAMEGKTLDKNVTYHCKKGTKIDTFLKTNGYTVKYITDSSFTLSGTITSFLSDTDSASVLLMKNGSVVNNAILKGTSAQYSFTDIEAGEYTLKVSKKNHVPYECSITFSVSDITQNVKICPKGDVNNDGKTTQTDYVTAMSYVRKTKELNDYQIKCGDVFGTPDGKLTAQDANRIVRHTRKVKLLY